MASGTIPFEYSPFYRSISSSENLNDYKLPGVYRWTSAPTNAPTYGIGTAWINAQMEVRRDNDLVTQVVMYNPGSNLQMPNVKRALANSTWGNWYPIIPNIIQSMSIAHGASAYVHMGSFSGGVTVILSCRGSRTNAALSQVYILSGFGTNTSVTGARITTPLIPNAGGNITVTATTDGWTVTNGDYANTVSVSLIAFDSGTTINGTAP